MGNKEIAELLWADIHKDDSKKETRIHRIELVLDQKDAEWVSRLGVVREALKHPAEIYDSWVSTNGNPMMLANPEKCKLAKQALQTLKEMGCK